MVITKSTQEISPAKAADLLGMSRPQIRRLMDEGMLLFRMVGSHHRIAIDDLKKYLESERKRRNDVRKKYAELQYELELFV